MKTVQLESNYKEARALGSWFLLSLIAIGVVLYFFLTAHDEQSASERQWSEISMNAARSLSMISELDAGAKVWHLNYGIAEQQNDQAKIEQLSVLLGQLPVASLGNLDLNEGLSASKRYWTSASEHALQQSLLRKEATSRLYTLLAEAEQAKPSQSLLSNITSLPEQHAAFMHDGSETALAAIQRSLTNLSKASKALAANADSYRQTLERSQTLRNGYDAAIVELQALRHERQFDLPNMLLAMQQQASARIILAKDKNTQLSQWFYGALAIVAVLMLIRAVLVSKKMHAQAMTIQNNQSYMLDRMESSEASAKAKTSFLSVLSYEARTALDSILGLTRIAQHGAVNPDQDAKLGEVIKASDNLNGLLDDVLNFLDLELGSVVLEEEAFSPKDVLALLMRKHATNAKNKNILFEHDVDPSLNAVYIGDQKRFYQALNCLLSNAIRYTEKGHVIFTLSVDTGQSLSPDVQRINVRIEDTGMALTKDEANSLFDPFSSATFKASRKSGGAGVRLSTAARLIAMMDGEVEVESSKGHGVVFNFYLHLGYADPGTKPIETTSLEDTISQDKVDLRHLKIMVVEDNLTNSSLLKWILEDLEHEVEVAENGVECLNMLESKDYDLIFMDQHMPEMDGEEATRRIRERQDHKANIPIIGCTADAFQETRDLLTSAGQNDVISKPISNDIVFEVTQKFLSGSYKPVAEPKQDKV